jgi:uncharacterized protein (TIGR03437 family)
LKRNVLFVLMSCGCLWTPIPLKAQTTVPVITEFALPTAAASPTGIALGSDGNLWVTEMTGNKIARITSSGAVTEYTVPTNNSQPSGITGGPDGNLWFTELEGNKIGQITVNGAITEYALPTLSSAPAGIAAGPDGQLWFVESMANQVGSITTSGAIHEYVIHDLAEPASIAAGPDGRLWFTEPTANKIGAITPAGAITEYPLIPAFNAQSAFSPQGITQGPDGNLWFTGTNTVWSMTTGGIAVQYTVPTPNFEPAGIVTGPDGNLWFADPSRNDIGMLTAAGVFAVYPIPTASAVPANLAVGSDGNLWFTEEGSGRVARVVLSATAPASGALTVNPPSFSFTGYAGGPPPPTQTLTVTSSAPVVFTATSSVPVSIGQSWLQISPSGNLTTNQTITVSVNQAGMGTSGNYVGNISLTSGAFTRIVTVTLTITAPPKTGNISVSPSSLSFSTSLPSPAAQEILIQNATQGVSFAPVTVSYNVVSPSGGNWLTLAGGSTPFASGSGGTAGSGFYATVNASELSPGNYAATITVAATAGNTVTIPVSLSVTPSQTTVSAVPPSLEFVWQVGTSSPPAQSFQVVETGTPEPFQIEPGDGDIIEDATPSGNSVTVTINTFGLSQGTYVQPVGATLLPFSLGEGAAAFVILTAQSSQSNITRILNAASLGPGVIAPGEMISIFGTNLGPSAPLSLALDPSGNVSTSLGGVSVSIGGHLAPLVYVSSSQINCVVPYELSEEGTLEFSNIPVVVTSAGQQNSYTMTAGTTVPAVFTSNSSGTDPAAILNGSGGYNGPDNPAMAGSTIVLYVTGEGQTLPAGVTGAVTQINNSPGASLTPIPPLPLRVTIGGVQAPVTFFGEAPGVVSGVMQINAQIPAGLPSGDLPLLVSLGGVSSRTGVTVSVK